MDTNHDQAPRFDPPLSPLEQDYAERFRALFARVDARQPEKGVYTLIQNARAKTVSGLTAGDCLEREYQAALQRTERRLELLAQCPSSLGKGGSGKPKQQ